MPKKSKTPAPVIDTTFQAIETLDTAPAADVVAPVIDQVLADAEVDALIAEFAEGDTAGAVDPANEPVLEPDGQSDVPEAGDEEEPAEMPDFAEVRQSFSEEEVAACVDDVKDAFAARDHFEFTKGGHYDSIKKGLEKSSKKLATVAAATVLLACDTDPYFVNKGMTTASGYNVYAIDKVADLVMGLSAGFLKNAINKAIVLSLFACKAEGIEFTGEVAKACASDKIRIDASIRKHLIRHTVAASTAPTQASSTMSALQTLGLVENTGSQKAPIYRLTDTPQTRRLEEIALKAA